MTELQMRASVIATALQMNALGINHGKSGNVSARWSNGFVVTPTGLSYELTAPADLAWVPLDATDERNAVGPRRPSSEWRLHRDIYARRPEVSAIVHTHSPFATSLACHGRGIPPFHYMVAIAGGKDIRCAGYATFGTQALSDEVLQALVGRRACLMAHHGMVAVGPLLDSALALAVEVEALARMYWQALQLGEPPLLSDEEMSTVLAKFTTYGQPLK